MILISSLLRLKFFYLKYNLLIYNKLHSICMQTFDSLCIVENNFQRNFYEFDTSELDFEHRQNISFGWSKSK